MSSEANPAPQGDSLPEDKAADDTTEDNVDPREAEARTQGWVPKDEWKGPEDRWRTLDEFLDVGERINRNYKDLKGQLESQEVRNRQLQTAMDQLIAGQSKALKAEHDRTVAELKAERKEAIINGDIEKVEKLDDAIDRTAKEVIAPPARSASTPTDPEKVAEIANKWVEKNAWFNTDPAAAAYAKELDRAYSSLPIEDSLALIEVKVRQRYPQHFEAPTTLEDRKTKRKTSAVEGSARRTSGRVESIADLPEAFQEVARGFADSGVMTVKEYIKKYNAEANK